MFTSGNNLHRRLQLALERAIQHWYEVGSGRRGGEIGSEVEGFHALEGPKWDGSTVRWVVDLGRVEGRPAFDDLSRRLAGWSNQWGVPVELLYVGTERD